MPGYWLKLYTEILDDPKYFHLSDNSKLGMIELMVVAKKIDMDGEIPSIEDVAFYTRRAVEWWEPVFDELSKIEYLVKDGSETIIRKFSERQKAIDSTERQRMSREAKHQKEFSHECVTNVSRNVTENRVREDIEKEKEKEKEVDVSTNNNDIISDANMANLNDVFEESTGLLRSECNRKDLAKWDHALEQFTKTGAMPETIAKTIGALKVKGGYVIAGPWSIARAVQIEMANQRQTVPRTDDNTKYIHGPYSEFINH